MPVELKAALTAIDRGIEVRRKRSQGEAAIQRQTMSLDHHHDEQGDKVLKSEDFQKARREMRREL